MVEVFCLITESILRNPNIKATAAWTSFQSVLSSKVSHYNNYHSKEK